MVSHWFRFKGNDFWMSPLIWKVVIKLYQLGIIQDKPCEMLETSGNMTSVEHVSSSDLSPTEYFPGILSTLHAMRIFEDILYQHDKLVDMRTTMQALRNRIKELEDAYYVVVLERDNYKVSCQKLNEEPQKSDIDCCQQVEEENRKLRELSAFQSNILKGALTEIDDYKSQLEFYKNRFKEPSSCDFEHKVHEVLTHVADMLVAKNKAYGNSALEPLRCFSKASSKEAILVRIDDKLSRIMRGQDIGEDTVMDLIGYLVLLRLAS